jgi:hypothetical protein
VRTATALALTLTLGCATHTPHPTGNAGEDALRCCQQCREASRKDPAARPVEDVPCAEYGLSQVNGHALVDAECLRWFHGHEETVATCRKKHPS